MPIPLLTMFVQMLPVLQAHEAIQASTVIAMGSGQMLDRRGRPSAAAQRIHQEWLKQANVVTPLDLGKVSPELARARIEAMGFKVS